MKRIGTTVLLLALAVATGLAQYPEVNVADLQRVPVDSLLAADAIANFNANSTQPRWTLQTSPYNGDTVRVTGAKRDDLQGAMALIRKEIADAPLSFDNFRD